MNDAPAAFDPFAPAFLADPYPVYARLRRESPVLLVEPYKAYWVFRHADVLKMLEDKETFLKNPTPPSPPPFGVTSNMPPSVFTTDPPRHTQLRQILDPLLAQAIAGAATLAETTAKTLLGAVQPLARADLINAYALPLPSQVLFTVLGIPPDDWRGLIAWVTQIVAANLPVQPVPVLFGGGTCAMALRAYYQALMHAAPRTPPAGLLDLARVKGEPLGLKPEEIQASFVTFTIAGYLSTTFLIGTGAQHLIDNPGQLALLRQRPELWGGAIAEMLRMDAPVQVLERVAARDTQVAGVAIRKGQLVSAVIGSANRDADAFPDPDAFRVDRPNAGQVGFGAGIHRCYGAPLASVVAPVALRVLFETLPKLRVAGLPQFLADPYLRGYANLPLGWG